MDKKVKIPNKAPTQKGKNSREAILDAAMKAFARNGFEGASMPKIAKMANVAPPLIHYYFGSKDNLWRETVDHSLGSLQRDAAAICEAMQALAPLDRLRALIQSFTLFAARCPDQFVMVIAEARSESERFTWIKEKYTSGFIEIINTVISDAHDKDQIRDIDVYKLSLMIMGAILLCFSLDQNEYNDESLVDFASSYAEVIYDIFLNGIKKI